MSAYLTLAASAFLAATLLPASSEAVLAGLIAAGEGELVLLWAVATVANTAGSAVNYALGRFLLRFRDQRWFPASDAQIARAHDAFQKYGSWSLLFAWAPLVGDALTVAAGALRTDWRLFVLLVAIGKGARYVGVILATQGAMEWWR